MEKRNPAHLTEFWKAVQSSVNTSEVGVSSNLYFFLIDWSVTEKSDTYLRKKENKLERVADLWAVCLFLCLSVVNVCMIHTCWRALEGLWWAHTQQDHPWTSHSDRQQQPPNQTPSEPSVWALTHSPELHRAPNTQSINKTHGECRGCGGKKNIILIFIQQFSFVNT